MLKIGQVIAVASAAFALVIACGGSTSSGISDPDAGASSSSGASSGASSGTTSSGSSGCSGQCPAIGCPTGTVSVTHEGQCCPTCDPIKNQCAGKPDDCSNKNGCGKGYDKYEYAPGCCDCRLQECKDVQCKPFAPCALGEHPDLSGCCWACVKDTTQCGPNASPCDTYQCPPLYKPVGLQSDGAGCCSSCEPDPNACANERKAYDTWLEGRLAEPGALDCQTSDDCQISTINTACRQDCGHAVAKKAASDILKDANDYSDQHCKGCPPENIGCTAVVLIPKCNLTKHKCTTGL